MLSPRNFYKPLYETPMKGIVMNKYVAQVKDAVKRHVPEIITVTASAAALVAYAAFVIKTNDNSIKIHLGSDAMNALEDGSLTTFKTEDEAYIYTIAQK